MKTMKSLNKERYYDIAEQIHSTLGNDVKYVPKESKWYKSNTCFNIHTWMVKEFGTQLYTHASTYIQKAVKENDVHMQDRYKEMGTSLMEIHENLQKKVYRDKILEELKTIMDV